MAGHVEPLNEAHLSEVKELLLKGPADHVCLLGLLNDFGMEPRPGAAPFTFYGYRESTKLEAVVFVGGGGSLLVPSLGSLGAMTEFGKELHGKVVPRSIRGEKVAVDTLMRFLATTLGALNRTERLYKCSADDLGPLTNPTLRLATPNDLEQLLPMAAACVKEMMGVDPLALDAKRFAAHVEARIRHQRTYVLEGPQRQLIFKVDVASRSSHGAELECLYTVPQERRMGHAALCLGQLSRHLLSSLPRLTLRIDEGAVGLEGLARKVGYLPGRSQRFVVL